MSRLKHADVWFVYQDWTLEPEPRCFYCGKGDERRLKRRYRNKHHRHVAQKHGMERRVLFGTRDEQFALDEEVRVIAEMHTYVYDPAYNGLGANYTSGGDGVSGHRDTLEQRARRSVSQLRAWQDAEIRAIRIAVRNRPEVNAILAERASITQRANWRNAKYRIEQTAAIKVAQNQPHTQAKRRASNAQAAKKQWNDNYDKMLSVLQSDEYREKQRLSHLGKQQRCGVCGGVGHKRTSCKVRTS